MSYLPSDRPPCQRLHDKPYGIRKSLVIINLSCDRFLYRKVIAERNKRSTNKELEFIIEQYVSSYEDKYGCIKVED
jgi:hypothetical protein